MIRTVLTFLLLVTTVSCFAQRYVLEKSKIRFYSEAPVEDIEAVNTESVSIIDLTTGEMAFSVPMRSFIFDKALMQEHFNENYLESHKYPKATFTGLAVNWEKFSGTRKTTVSGKMNIHGVVNNMEITGDMAIYGDKVVVDAVFVVKLVDHKIKIPTALFYNIAEEIEVTVHFEYKPYK